MLYYKTVDRSTIDILKQLQNLHSLQQSYLAGDTALALIYGHRKSIDLDLFGADLQLELIAQEIIQVFGSAFQYELKPSNWALYAYINNLKVNIVNFNYAMIQPVQNVDQIRLASIDDISAMKIKAILGRGSKKDFWDINELLKNLSLEAIIGNYRKKFPNQALLISVPQALTYFEDANNSPDPISLTNQKWSDVKTSIQKYVKQYLY